MATKANAAYFGTTGKLEAGTNSATDEYTAAVTSCMLNPTPAETTVTDIGGGVSNLMGVNAWEVVIGYNQDWNTTGSFARWLRDNHGQIKTFKYTPAAGGDVASFTALVKAGPFGGAGAALHAAEVTLKINGQPTFAPAT